MKAREIRLNHEHVAFAATVAVVPAGIRFRLASGRAKVAHAGKSPCRSRVVVASMEKAPHTSLLSGGALLACILVNRIVCTPVDEMCPPQARSDILAVVASATLILYGLGRIDVGERRASVDMGGVEIEDGFETDVPNPASAYRDSQVRWTARTLFSALPNVKSFALVLARGKSYRIGRFRDIFSFPFVKAEGIADRVLKTGERAYLADLKVVSVKEVEFDFLPRDCQSILIQPLGSEGVMILGADRPRPFTGQDFGWLQAVGDYLTGILARSSDPD